MCQLFRSLLLFVCCLLAGPAHESRIVGYCIKYKRISMLCTANVCMYVGASNCDYITIKNSIREKRRRAPAACCAGTHHRPPTPPQKKKTRTHITFEFICKPQRREWYASSRARYLAVPRGSHKFGVEMFAHREARGWGMRTHNNIPNTTIIHGAGQREWCGGRIICESDACAASLVSRRAHASVLTLDATLS